MNAELRLDLRCNLGEGIIWVNDPVGGPGQFLCVDINGQQIYSFDESAQNLRVWQTPERVGWVIPTRKASSFLAGFQSGFANLTLTDTLCVERLVPSFASRPDLRLNDAYADRNGVIWAGSMNCESETLPDGVLFRYTPNGELTTVDTGYSVANGPALSTDGKTFLHTDSVRRTIYAFDFDDQASTITNKRVWKIFEEAEGSPDGMTFDAANTLWVAHWGAGLVSNFALSGELLSRVQLPVSNITNVAFGGASLDRLFVTTARHGLSAAQLDTQPNAGGVFEIVGHSSVGILSNVLGEPSC